MMRMRKPLVLLAVVCVLPVAVHADGLSDFFRAVTGVVSGSNKRADPNQPTATVGIRGMDETSDAAVTGAQGDLKQLDAWMVTPVQAQAWAAQRGLQPRTVNWQTPEAAP